MTSQTEAYHRFRDLHAGADAFVMPNAWDGASAVLLGRAGFAALGSTSLAIAFALGRPDGLALVSRDEAIDNAACLASVSGLPVNGDLEDGFGPAPEDCALTVEAAIAGGLAGLGIEDTTANPSSPIHAFDDAVRRVEAAARAAKGRIMLTARADNFINDRPDLDDTVRRLVAFAEAGADVLYAPGLPDVAAIETVARAVAPRPVNVLVSPAIRALGLGELGLMGVKRLSLGGALYRYAMTSVAAAASRLAAGDLLAASGAIPSKEIEAMLPRR